MWLIDTFTFTLCYVNDSKVRRYAILSHVWQAGNELTFQEFRNGEGKHKSGYAKIVGTCKKLRSHGYLYAWVDSICINKESSAELSEAINSMWQWYCDAEVCYVYLEDISAAIQVVDRKASDLTHERSSASAGKDFEIFSRSKWFSRGWTLQELIAPKEVLFYNLDWRAIGRKSEMLETLAKITAIDILVLEDRLHLDQFVAARKLSWASHRSTTRIEDHAYSMLGIMNINMPLLYGEGYRAFIRLQEEIIKYTDDQSIFAWEVERPISDRAADMLFADSPVRFKSCSRVVAWNNELHDPFRVTNKGVAFDGLFFDENRMLAILNCRHEDNLSGPIALRVLPAALRSTPVNLSHGEWWPGRYHPRTKLYDHGELEAVCTKLAVRKLTLYRTDPTLSAPSPSPLKLQICRHPDTAEGTIIRNAWPESQWNKSTGIFSAPMRCSTTETLMTMLELQSMKTRVRFWLGIRLTWVRRPNSVILNDPNPRMIEVVLSYTSFEHVQTEMRLGTHGRTAILGGSPSTSPSYQPTIRVAPQVKTVNILGDVVLKIEILIGRHANLQSDRAKTTVLIRNDASPRTNEDASNEMYDSDGDNLWNGKTLKDLIASNSDQAGQYDFSSMGVPADKTEMLVAMHSRAGSRHLILSEQQYECCIDEARAAALHSTIKYRVLSINDSSLTGPSIAY